MLTFDAFVNGYRRAAQRKRATEIRLFGPRRRVALPPSELDPDVAAELDAVATEMRGGKAKHWASTERDGEQKKKLSRMFWGQQ